MTGVDGRLLGTLTAAELLLLLADDAVLGDVLNSKQARVSGDTDQEK